jgi:hypothetical protein
MELKIPNPKFKVLEDVLKVMIDVSNIFTPP